MAVGKETMRIPPLDFGGPSCPRRGCWLIHSSSAHRWLDQAALVRAPRHPTGGPLAGPLVEAIDFRQPASSLDRTIVSIHLRPTVRSPRLERIRQC